MEWGTLLATAGVSAVVSALVSLWAVRMVTVRRAKAERADAARRAVRAEAEKLLRALARYRYTEGRPTPARGNTAEADDHAAVVRIRNAATDLPAWRRWLVDRRCRRVFGDYWTDLAIDYPSDLESGAGTFIAHLNERLRAKRADGRGNQSTPADSLIHRAYSELPGHPALDELRRELRHLAASR